MKAVFVPKNTSGVWNAIPSKSLTHRAFIAAALANGESRIENALFSDDTNATLDSLAKLGAHIEKSESGVLIRGFSLEKIPENAELFVGESGSTLRFLIPISLFSGKTVTFRGSKRLFERPLDAYEAIAREHGFLFERKADRLTVRGRAEAGDYCLSTKTGSQFVTGLLFALPLLFGESRILLSEKPESEPYIDLTLDTLARFGVRNERPDERTFIIPGGQRFAPRNFAVEGDESNAAFFAALRELGFDVEITGLSPETKQGDKIFRNYFAALREGTPTLDLSDCPDLAPILFALAGAENGGVFTHATRLRQKESDRIASMQEELSKFGITLLENGGTVTVAPGFHAPKEPLFAHNDHRVAMALSVLLTKTGGELFGAECVSKSDPGFFDSLKKLGFAVEIFPDEDKKEGKTE